MPRRNRRAPQQARPIKMMSPSRQRALRAFAVEHLAEHAYARGFYTKDELVVTGSECPTTGVRFLSAGRKLDRLAVRLAALAESSDPHGNLAA